LQKAIEKVICQKKNTKHMKKKEVKIANIPNAEKLFQDFYQEATGRLGFYEVPSSLEERDKKLYNIEAPDVPRVQETSGQVILEKERDGYTIRVLASYDRSLKGFTRSGRLWVLVVTPDKKKGKKILLARYFLRKGDKFLKKTLLMMEYLWDRLIKRPLRLDGKLMELVETYEERYDRFSWAPKGKGANSLQARSFFMDDCPSHLVPFVWDWVKHLRRYELIVRPKMGYKERARNIRKKWKVKKAKVKK
jgi:hypothetical protein